MNRDQVLGPQAIQNLIADGHTIVISDEHVLKLDGWLSKHPGGRLAIMHMVGRDATDEINVYHSANSLRQMRAFRIGRIAEPWTNLTPPIRGGVYLKIEESAKPASETSELAEDADDVASLSDDDALSVPHSIFSTPDNSSTTSLSALSRSTSLDDGQDISCKASVTGDVPDIDSVDGSPIDHGLRLRSSLCDPKSYNEALSKSSSLLAASHLTTPSAFTSRMIQEEIDKDVFEFPSVDESTQRSITQKYKALHQRVKDEGFYDCRYLEYGKEMCRYSLLFALCITSLRYEWYFASACFLGTFWQQIMFTAHDAGHAGITHHFKTDTLIALFVADFCCGLSMGWWKSSHNVHHLITNDPEHDPDIQNVPLFATSPSFFKSIHSSYYDFTYVWDAVASFMVPYQKYTYYPIMGVARFNLYLLSWLHLLSPRSTNLGSAWWTRPTEVAFMCCYWFLFGYCLVWRSIPTWTLRIMFVLVSHIVTMPLHVQITLSHWGMPTADLGPGESFPQRQLRTTMDVDCPAWMDFYHGGLQFQAIHHLFPRVPRHNLRRLQVLVRAFCAETGIEYKCLGFVDGNKEVIGRLGEIGKQVEILVQCQKYMAETGESGLH